MITAITQTGKRFEAPTIKEATQAAGAAVAPVSVHCDQCQIVVIQGVACHESGCPNGWRDEVRSCKWCGSRFRPEERHSTCCSPCCVAAYNGHTCDCENCRTPTTTEGTDDT